MSAADSASLAAWGAAGYATLGVGSSPDEHLTHVFPEAGRLGSTVSSALVLYAAPEKFRQRYQLLEEKLHEEYDLEYRKPKGSQPVKPPTLAELAARQKDKGVQLLGWVSPLFGFAGFLGHEWTLGSCLFFSAV